MPAVLPILRACALCALLSVIVLLPSIGAAQEHPDESAEQHYLREQMEDLRERGRLRVRGITIMAEELIADLYGRRRYEPAWDREKTIEELLQIIGEAELDGLRPNDYHLKTLRRLRKMQAEKPSPQLHADLDILLTDALARLCYHLYYGKVDPERVDQTWNWHREWRGVRGAEAAQQFISSDSLRASIDMFKPKHPAYNRYRQALAQYRAYAKAGGWKPIPSVTKSLKEGQKNSRVATLRHRLAITGDLPADLDNGSELYDEAVSKAVNAFQERHHLRVGRANPNTLRALNVPARKRVEQIRVNLERARWIIRDLEPSYIVVNIAAFTVKLVREGKQVWFGKAQVGKTFSQTPLFREEMRYLVFNPTWTVPPGPMKRNVLPGARKDPRYFKKHGLQVRTFDGEPVNATRINWNRYSADDLPYKIVQAPGPDNALGLVKFMFPNKYHVYLHDTPKQLGYKARRRAMSFGCIHVENPLEFAAVVINDPKTWDKAAIDGVIKKGKPRTVYLENELPVLLLYWTTAVREDGVVEFFEDIYKRDRRILRGLNGRFLLRKQRRRFDPED